MLKAQSLFACILFTIASSAQTYSADSLEITEVRASETDTNIDFELAKHYIFYNPTSSASVRRTLVVYLPGSFDIPKNTLLFPSVAANMGYHVVSLKYENSVSAEGACRNSTDSNCYAKYREEIVEGTDLSPEVDVDSTNCIENRLEKLLTYLHANHPNDGWDTYVTGTEINWNKIAVAGHSQGGGHAAYIGLTKPLMRVLMFASPNDWSEHFNAPAKWVTNASIADKDFYYAFGNLNDDIAPFSEQYAIWDSMGMIKRPHIDTSLVDGNDRLTARYTLLYTKFNQAGLSVNHNSPVRDSDTPMDSEGTPLFEEAWKAMLGLERIPGNVPKNISEELKYFPNPAQSFIQLSTLKNVKITITNSIGEAVISIESSDGVIDIRELKSGLYFMQAEKNGQLFDGSFIKQ